MFLSCTPTFFSAIVISPQHALLYLILRTIRITSSITAHIVGSGSKKHSNVKGIKIESTKIILSLDDNTAAPSSYTLNPVAVLKDSSKKMLLHTAEFRYATSNSSVATVGKDGTITAKGKGTCYIYVYAQNGYAKKIKVTVK